MDLPVLSVRELTVKDIPLIADYWLKADTAALTAMGVDLSKMPTREQMSGGLAAQLALPLNERRAYCIIWEIDGKPVGHCNTNPSFFGIEAFMHLHLWQPSTRHSGIGLQLLGLTLPYFFRNLEIDNLYSEPYALNPAPNKTLKKAGFAFVKEYLTIPGSLNFEQPVKQWLMTREKFEWLANTKLA
ncbi:MAG: hypothetical protein JWQ27_330 [Ferruginibacter sp.]|nr:hypothetical protein [Ferruginibacter sp.]